MVSGLAHLNLRAPSPLLEALRDFYAEVVGLHVGHRPPFDSHGYWLYAGERDVLHLSACSAEEAAQRQGRSSYDHIAFACSDLTVTEARLQRLGVRFERRSVPRTGQVQLFLTDPAGLGVELNFAPPTVTPLHPGGTST